MTLGRCTAQLAGAIEELLRREMSESVRSELTTVFAELDRPLRVAVTGRVNAGKSTLVNALLTQRIAPTDVSECTRYATWFSFGVPERVEVVLVDGTRRAIGLRPDGRLPASLRDRPGRSGGGATMSSTDTDADHVEVDRLEVFLSNDTLRRLTLIDTPGLASTREEIRPTEELLALDRRSRSALAGADAMVFVLGDGLRLDDAALLTLFGRLMSGITTSAVNAVMILSRIDQMVPPDLDPIELTRPRTDALAETLGPAVATVVPLVGLHAESSECGALTDDDLAALRTVTAAGPILQRALSSVDLFERDEGLGIDAHRRSRLLELLDLRGVALLADAARSGADDAELVALLRARSGIDELRSVIDELAANADVLKASWALGGLERLAFTSSSPDREHLLDVVERCELDPALHRLRELAALNEVVRAGPAAHGAAHAELLSFIRGAPDGEAGPAPVSGRVAHWRSVANDGASDPTSRSVAAVLARSYELLADALPADALPADALPADVLPADEG